MDPLLGYKPDVSLIPAASGPILAMKGGGPTEDNIHHLVFNFLRDPSNNKFVKPFPMKNVFVYSINNIDNVDIKSRLNTQIDNYTYTVPNTHTISETMNEKGEEVVRIQYDLIVSDTPTVSIDATTGALDPATTDAVIKAATDAAVEAVKVHLASAPVSVPVGSSASSGASSGASSAPVGSSVSSAPLPPAPLPPAPVPVGSSASSASVGSSASSAPAPIINRGSPFNNVNTADPSTNGILIPNIQASMYYPRFFQPQITALGCGRFALNNLFHNERFVFNPSKGFQSTTDNGLTRDQFSNKYSQEFSKMATRDQINLSEVCHIVSRFLLMNGLFTADNSCRDNEYFSMDVLQSALQIIGHETNEVQILDNTKKPIDMATFHDYDNHDLYVRDDATNTYTLSSDNKNLLGYIINYGKDHYVALRKLPKGNKFEYLDSQEPNTNRTGLTTFEFLKYVTTMNKRIVSIRQVLNITKSINPFETLQAEYEKERAEDTGQDKLKRQIIKLFATNYQTFITNHPAYTEDIAAFLTSFDDYNTEVPTLLSILERKDLVVSNTKKLEEYMKDKQPYIQEIKKAKDEYLKEQRTKGSSSIKVALLPQAKDMIALFNKTDGGKRKLRRRRVTKKK